MRRESPTLFIFALSEKHMAKKLPVQPKNSPTEAQPTPSRPKSVASFIKGTYFPFTSLGVQILILTAVVLIFFGNTIVNKYALDDDVVILRNDHVQAGLKGIPDLLNKDSFHGYLKKNTDFLPGGRYRPLSLITFAIEQEFAKDNSYLGHAVNIILFGLTVVLLLLLLRNHFFPKQPDLAFLATFLFAIHPIHTEVVANIKSRDEILSLLLLLLMLYTLFDFLRMGKKNISLLIGSLVSYFLALMAKENGVMMVILLPMTLFTFTRLKIKDIAVWTAPYMIVMGIYLAIRQSVIGGLDVAYEDLMTNPYQLASNAQKFCTKVYVLLKYLMLMFFPHPLSWDYSYNAVAYRDFSSPDFWIALIVTGGLIAWALVNILKKNPIAYGILFFYLSLALVSNFIINIGAPLGERFTYQGSVGFGIAIAAGLLFLADKLISVPVSTKRMGLIALIAFITIPAAAKTIQRNAQWYDSITIALTDVKTLPESAKTNMSAGDASMARGHRANRDSIALRVKCYQDAIMYFNETLRITPDWKHAGKRMGEAYYELAQIADSLGVRNQEDLAQKVLKKGIPAKEMSFELLKTSVKWDTLRHNAWTNLGHMYTQRNNRPEALKCFMRAVTIMPDTFTYWYNVGAAHFELQTLPDAKPIQGMNHLDSAIKYFTKANELRPNWPDYLYDLGAVYFMAKNYPEAEARFTKALQLNPNHPGANNGLRLARQAMGKS
jgi:tetratricopeptide (TPR) repeat protein